jgi:3-deoxy-D-manno-octulosonate 8-phosphate phosphatase (KDO 8-P phosphatase)
LPTQNDLLQKAANIKLAVFDVDGVLTDGRLYFTDKGDGLKAFNVKDGLGMKLLQNAGIKTAIITGRSSEPVKLRAAELGVDYFYEGREDKVTALHEIMRNIQVTAKEIAYIGDDLPDIKAIQAAGFGAAVADALPIVIKHADWVSTKNGGCGAAREFCEFILEAQGTLEKALAAYVNT